MAEPIVNLYEGPSRVQEVLEGPWRDIRVQELAAGESIALSTAGEEHVGFVIDGAVVVRNDDGAHDLARNGAFALPTGGAIDVTAGAEGARLLLVTMRVGH